MDNKKKASEDNKKQIEESMKQASSAMAKTIFQTFRYMQKNGIDVGIIYSTGDSKNSHGAMIMSTDGIADSVSDDEAINLAKLYHACRPLFAQLAKAKWNNEHDWMEVAADFFVFCWSMYQSEMDNADKGKSRSSLYTISNSDDKENYDEPESDPEPDKKPSLNDANPTSFGPIDDSHKA